MAALQAVTLQCKQLADERSRVVGNNRLLSVTYMWRTVASAVTVDVLRMAVLLPTRCLLPLLFVLITAMATRFDPY